MFLTSTIAPQVSQAACLTWMRIPSLDSPFRSPIPCRSSIVNPVARVASCMLFRREHDQIVEAIV